MVKKAILLLSAVAGLTNAAMAQKCATDDLHQEFIQRDPQVKKIQDALDMRLKGASVLKSDNPDFDVYQDSLYQAEISKKMIIPVVVHVIHDYNSSNGADYVKDNDIYKMIENLNKEFSASNADISAVIDIFKPYIGNANIEFRLAAKDPLGKPTTGITRRQSYLTVGGDEQAKFDLWAPDRYLNIWTERKIGRGADKGIVLAYATLPAGAAANPWSDGVIVGAPYILDQTHTIAHEVGHYLNLYHTWNSNQKPVATIGACGDDEVDDTPPTIGHFSTCQLYDGVCDTGYVKMANYNGDPVVIDYPDTANTQNIMDYSSCTNMFTKLQVMRMRNTLKTSVANRDNLVSGSNGDATGTGGDNYKKLDLPPVADFSMEKGAPLTAERMFYACTGEDFMFKNQSWRDTVTSVKWEFTNGGTITPGTTNNQLNGTIAVKFTEPGWATIKLTATGNNTGESEVVEKKVYVSDRNYRVPQGYVMEFNQGEDEKWPAFNYYNNQSSWHVSNSVGYYDNTSLVFNAYDARIGVATRTGTPAGDYDDIFTPAYDLSAWKDEANCNINFMSASAFRTTNPLMMNDAFQISYSNNCGVTWTQFVDMKKTKLANKGSQSQSFAPLWTGDWVLNSYTIPTAARDEDVMFRLRYKPSVDEKSYVLTGSGNNLFIDRINISNFPLGVNTIMSSEKTMVVAPNPTTGSSYVVMDGSETGVANMIVTDMTGKVVYRTTQQLGGSYSRIEIPAEAIAVKGIYMVQVLSNNKTQTEKLVVY